MMRTLLLASLLGLSFMTAAPVLAQPVTGSETAHLAREHSLDEATEARRLQLNQKLQAAQKVGDAATVVRIKAMLAGDDQQLQREKAMHTADTANGGLAAHEARERQLDEATERRRESLHRQVAAAQKAGKTATAARIQAELAADDQQLAREKAMHAADGPN